MQFTDAVCSGKHIQVLKILKINNYFLAVKQPLNCQSKEIYLLTEEGDNFYILHSSTSIHCFLPTIDTTRRLLSLGRLTVSQVDDILRRHTNIQFIKPQPQQRQKPNPCYIYRIFRKPFQIYGLPSKSKAGKSIKNMFSKYRKISRNI